MLQFILILSLLLNFQKDNQSNYFEYHRSINRADELITKKKYEEALSKLENVFDEYGFVFLRDYKVACQLAFFTQKEIKGFSYLKLGISKGWKLKEIKRNDFLTSFLSDTKWEIIEDKYDSIRNVYLRSINESLRSKVHKMYKLDQKKAIGALLRIGNKAQERYGENKFAPHSEEQLAELDKILIEYGYPGEKLIGDNWWVSIIVSHHNSISYEYVHNDTIFQYLSPKFLEAIKKGEMSPYEFALMEDWKTAVENNHQKTSYGFLGSIETKALIDEINQNRKIIGMRSISIRNALIDIKKETGMDFYLPGQPWQNEKITVANSR